MTKSPELTVLEAHRHRVAYTKTYQEFQEAQLDFLDYLIASKEASDIQFEAAKSYLAKWEEWSDK